VKLLNILIWFHEIFSREWEKNGLTTVPYNTQSYEYNTTTFCFTIYKEAQSFTLLNADICIDINGGFCFEQVSWLNRNESRALLRFGKVNSKENICTFSLLLIWVNIPSLNIAISSRKCFVMVQPANEIKSLIDYWRKSVFNEVNNLAQNQLIHNYNKKVQNNLISFRRRKKKE